MSEQRGPPAPPVETRSPAARESDRARSQAEEADDYHAVVARLNGTWRIIVCSAANQWVLQRRRGKRCGRARWEGRSFCRTSEALNRLSRTHAGVIDPTAAAILAALPDRIEAPDSPTHSPTTCEAAEAQV
jgi:hypothetical protein